MLIQSTNPLALRRRNVEHQIFNDYDNEFVIMLIYNNDSSDLLCAMPPELLKIILLLSGLVSPCFASDMEYFYPYYELDVNKFAILLDAPAHCSALHGVGRITGGMIKMIEAGSLSCIREHKMLDKWISTSSSDSYDLELLFQEAIAHNQVDIFEFFLESIEDNPDYCIKFRMYNLLCENAESERFFDFLELVREFRHIFVNDNSGVVLGHFVAEGDIVGIQRALDMGCEFDENVCYYWMALSNTRSCKQVECFKWLHKNCGKLFSTNPLDVAISRSNEPCVRYLFDQGYKLDEHLLRHCLRFFIEKYWNLIREVLMPEYHRCGRVSMITYAIATRTPVSNAFLEYLHDNGVVISLRCIIIALLRDGIPSFIKWFAVKYLEKPSNYSGRLATLMNYITHRHLDSVKSVTAISEIEQIDPDKRVFEDPREIFRRIKSVNRKLRESGII